MKRILFIISFSLLTNVLALAQMPQALQARAYPNGIYIFCGKEIPRNFYYLVEKQDASGAWLRAAELRAPQSAAALKASLLQLPGFFTASMRLPIDRADFFWERQGRSSDIDSLLMFTADPKVLAAVGCAWFDDGIAAGEYHYRVSKVYRTDAIALGEVSKRFPDNEYKGSLKTVRSEPEEMAVALYYSVSDPRSTGDVVLYRSRLMENNYQAMPARPTYASLDGQVVAVLRDESVARGMAYSYVAVPRDALGNMGTPSDTIQVYNLKNLADIGIVSSFKAVGDKEKKGIMLSWDMNSDFYIHGYEIFRSQDLESGYKSIITLPAGETSYLDSYGIEFGQVYFYYMVVNNGYGNNVRTPATPVALVGQKDNFLPPQNLSAELRDNVVHLSFTSVDPDTWGFQIFRGEGYMGELTQIGAFSIPQRSLVNGEYPMLSFTDTLIKTPLPQTYSYAVTDLNSSNLPSPMSERVSIQYSGGMLPAPSNMEAQLRGDYVWVLWSDVIQMYPYVSGYRLWRSVVSGETESEAQLIATLPAEQNNYVDSLIIPGAYYRYSTEVVGVNNEISGRSLYVGVAVPRQLPLPPGRVFAMATESSILLQWDLPLDPGIKALRIYRAISNAAPSLLKELPANQTRYEDRSAKQDEQYYYYVVTVNQRGEESRADEPVSARIRKR
jgi:hypothetical protein